MRESGIVRGFIVAALVTLPTLVSAQGGGGGGAGGGAGGRGTGGRGAGRGSNVVMDTARARALYVSNKREDLSRPNYASQRTARLRDDSIFAARSRGVIDYRKVTYKSAIDGLEIPAHLYQPLTTRGARGHAAMVWVHGGVHGHWSPSPYMPFIIEAVQRGYVVIAPEYRGSTGYDSTFYAMFDYGGKEVDDVIAAFDYLKTLPYVDTARVGIMGWSHGGFIASHALFRLDHPFKAGAAIVPVTNLLVRLARSGPGYQRDFSAVIGGMTHEKTADYVARSPVFQAGNLKVPILVHVATNDCDVYFLEDQQMVYTLRALKPELAETKIYVDPPAGGAGCGHTFSRRVDPVTLQRQDTPEQIDSWNRTWTFFDWNLRPYLDPSKPKS